MLDEFGEDRLDEIERVVAQEWARSNTRCVDQARAFVNWLRDQGYCTTNPFERPGISKGPGRKHDKPLTEDDLRALDEACAVLGAYAKPMRGWLHFQAYVGCRPAEGLGVERALDIDLKAGEVHIRQQKYRDGSLSTPKNGRERTIILPDPAREKLALIPTRLVYPWLFHNKRGDELLYPPLLGVLALHPRRVGAGRRPALAGADSQPKGVDPYHLRHFCGSHLADLGCTAQDIAEQLGHTDGGALA
jgi:integrase